MQQTEAVAEIPQYLADGALEERVKAFLSSSPLSLDALAGAVRMIAGEKGRPMHITPTEKGLNIDDEYEVSITEEGVFLSIYSRLPRVRWTRSSAERLAWELVTGRPWLPSDVAAAAERCRREGKDTRQIPVRYISEAAGLNQNDSETG